MTVITPFRNLVLFLFNDVFFMRMEIHGFLLDLALTNGGCSGLGSSCLIGC